MKGERERGGGGVLVQNSCVFCTYQKKKKSVLYFWIGKLHTPHPVGLKPMNSLSIPLLWEKEVSVGLQFIGLVFIFYYEQCNKYSKFRLSFSFLSTVIDIFLKSVLNCVLKGGLQFESFLGVKTVLSNKKKIQNGSEGFLWQWVWIYLVVCLFLTWHSVTHSTIRKQKKPIEIAR